MDFNLIPGELTINRLMLGSALSAGVALWLGKSISFIKPAHAAMFTATYLVGSKIAVYVLSKFTDLLNLSSKNFDDYIVGRFVYRAIIIATPIAVLTSPYLGLSISPEQAALYFAVFHIASLAYYTLREKGMVLQNWNA